MDRNNRSFYWRPVKFGWVDLMHPEDKERVLEILQRAFAGSFLGRGSFECRTEKGITGGCLPEVYPGLERTIRLSAILALLLDITELKNRQTQLELNNQLLATNKELTAINEEFQLSQPNLLHSNEQLAEREQILKLALDSSGKGF